MTKRYGFHEDKDHPGKVSVIRQRPEIRLGALLMCALLAVVFWLYIVGSSAPAGERPPPAESETTAPS